VLRTLRRQATAAKREIMSTLRRTLRIRDPLHVNAMKRQLDKHTSPASRIRAVFDRLKLLYQNFSDGVDILGRHITVPLPAIGERTHEANHHHRTLHHGMDARAYPNFLALQFPRSRSARLPSPLSLLAALGSIHFVSDVYAICFTVCGLLMKTIPAPAPPDARAAFIEKIMLAKTKEDAATVYGEIWSVLIRQALTWADGMLAERLANPTP
jgi:hypothetical protein